MNKTVQIFEDKYLDELKDATPTQIANWLEDYRLMMSNIKPAKSKLISIKIPEDLLSLFKKKAKLHNTAYQTQIKKLMMEWLKR